VGSMYGLMRVEAATKHGWEQAFEVVARNLTQHSCTGAQLVGLLRAGQTLHHSSSLDEFLTKSLDDALRTLSARSAVLILGDERTGRLTVQAARGEAQSKPCFSKRLTQRCFSRGESLLVHDVRDDIAL